jgi:tRNA (guanine10-N2)-dimethyltransferase
MLPPKLARMMVNMGTGQLESEDITLLDPFCGTGVVLQEAALLGYDVYGSDLSEKMVEYSRINLEWLRNNHRLKNSVTITQSDATMHRWDIPHISTVVCETYLGQPFSAPPSQSKLTEVRSNCDHIISEFLRNIAGQLTPGTPLCIAVPAWRDSSGNITHLPLIDNLSRLGYTRTELMHVRSGQLLYYRETQVVAREILLLTKS